MASMSRLLIRQILVGTMVFNFCAQLHASSIQQLENNGVVESINQTIAQLHASDDVAERVTKAEDLANLTASLCPDDIESLPDEIIDSLASLVEDPSAGVMHFAAMALGNLGPRAAPAVPVLEKVVAQIEEKERDAVIAPSMTAALELYVALNKITGRPLPQKSEASPL